MHFIRTVHSIATFHVIISLAFPSLDSFTHRDQSVSTALHLPNTPPTAGFDSFLFEAPTLLDCSFPSCLDPSWVAANAEVDSPQKPHRLHTSCSFPRPNLRNCNHHLLHFIQNLLNF